MHRRTIVQVLFFSHRLINCIAIVRWFLTNSIFRSSPVVMVSIGLVQLDYEMLLQHTLRDGASTLPSAL
jgi:hypothetical protein